MDQELFIVYSPDVQCGVQTFGYESRAQLEAEALARQNRGARFYIAKVSAFVSEPLPALQWSDGRQESVPAGRDMCAAETPLGKLQAPTPRQYQR